MTNPLPAPLPLFPAGYAPSASDFDTWITYPLRFCTSSVVFMVEQTVQQSFPQNTATTVVYDTVLYDPYGGWRSATNYWVAPYTGWYLVTATVSLHSLSAGGALFQVALDVSNSAKYVGADLQSEATTVSGAFITAMVPMTGGEDWVGTVMTAAGSVATYETDTSAPGRYPAMEVTFLSQ